MFAKHHYLSHSHNNAAHVYVAFVNEQLAGFISILHFPHPKVKNIKRVHRLVVMPDFQGIGIGVRLLEYIGKKYINNNFKYRITTSAPSLINYFKNNINWILTRKGRIKTTSYNYNHMKKSSSENRITTSWEYKL